MTASTRHWTRTVTITRPANATQYTANDGVSTTAGAILTFAGVATHAGGGGMIDTLYIHKTDQDTTSAAFRLHLFDTTVAVAGFNDGATMAVTDAEWQTGVGGIAIPQASWLNVVTGNVITLDDIGLTYACASGDTNLYGFVAAEDTYTPASAEVITIRLSGHVN